MLGVDHVRARRRDGELKLTKLAGKRRTAALLLAEQVLGVFQSHVGANRADLEQACKGIGSTGADRKIAEGLQKLVTDRAEFESPEGVEPRTLRTEIFRRATLARRALADGEHFDREAFLAAEATERDMKQEDMERALYADLRGAHLLLSVQPELPEQLLQRYERAQEQAVLLRAVSLTAEVRAADPGAYRALFNRLKFQRLLYRIEAMEGGYRVHIDGPFSMFSSATKYGLQLALALPVLQACDRWAIQASLRWGKERAETSFELQGKGGRAAGVAGGREYHMPEELESVIPRFEKLGSDWRTSAADELLHVPGQGVCAPDLRFDNEKTGEVCYLELMGYWSRDAVFKRVELVRAGLAERVIFALSSRLRVSEELLPDTKSSELYVYKGSLNARELLRRLESAPVTGQTDIFAP